MAGQGIFELDLRLIDPYHGKRQWAGSFQDARTPMDSTNTGLYHYANGELQVMTIKGGYSMLLDAAKNLMSFWLRIPSISLEMDSELESMLLDLNLDETRADPEDITEQQMPLLAKHYTFRRLAEECLTLDEYIESHQHMKNRNFGNDSFSVLQNNYMQRMESILQEHPEWFGIKGSVDEIWYEVAIAGKLSAVIDDGSNYNLLVKKKPTERKIMTATDLIVRDDKKKYYFFEIKMGNPYVGEGLVTSTAKRKAEKQLGLAGAFADYNYSKMPHLAAIFMNTPAKGAPYMKVLPYKLNRGRMKHVQPRKRIEFS